MKVIWLVEGHRKGYKAGTLWDYSRHLSSLSEFFYRVSILSPPSGNWWWWQQTPALKVKSTPTFCHCPPSYLPLLAPASVRSISPWWHNSSLLQGTDRLDAGFKRKIKVKHDFEVFGLTNASMLTLTEMVEACRASLGDVERSRLLFGIF